MGECLYINISNFHHKHSLICIQHKKLVLNLFFWPTYFGAFLNRTPLDLRNKFFQAFSTEAHRISRRLHALNCREVLSGIKPCFVDDAGFLEIAYTFFISMLAFVGISAVRILDLFSVAERIQMNIDDSYECWKWVGWVRLIELWKVEHS